jgi:transposase InsO family protein
MSQRIHPNARTTPRTRAEIQASDAPVRVLALRYGVSQTTIRRWRTRRDQADRSHRRHHLGQSTSPTEEALIAELRRSARLSLDDITEVMHRCGGPHLSRDAIYRALRRAGLSGRLAAQPGRPRSGRFEDTGPGFVHIDLKYLRKLKGRGDFAFVAIERSTRFVHLEVLPDRRAGTVAAAFARCLDALPFAVRIVLTDNGTEFTDRFRKGDRDATRARPSGGHPFDVICAERGIQHRLTRPYHPQTNGMVERFNRRLAEALRSLPPIRDNIRTGTKFNSHAQRAAFLMAFVADYNRTRLRCLKYVSPQMAVTNLTQHNTYGGQSAHVSLSHKG